MVLTLLFSEKSNPGSSKFRGKRFDQEISKVWAIVTPQSNQTQAILHNWSLMGSSKLIVWLQVFIIELTLREKNDYISL